METRVGAFTDTYLPTINGVTYTVKSWRDKWQANGGEMPIVFPSSSQYDPEDGEFEVRSLPFPFYDGYRLGVPQLPSELADVDIVHAHTPFGLGLAALRMVRGTDRPLVASFHTPCGEYTDYISPFESLSTRLRGVSQWYERWFLNHADVVVAPTESAATFLREEMGIDTTIDIVPNGVDLDRFYPRESTGFRERYELPDGPLIGYTGRHGYEKRLPEIIEAAAHGSTEWTIVLGGDGPASEEIAELADEHGIDLRMLGFLDREELPEFYSAIDVFAFPSPVETQGIVALESIACGTPVVGVKARALIETIEDGRTGYHYEQGDPEDFATQLQRAIDNQSTLEAGCLDARTETSLEFAMEALEDVYERVL